jgi:hypothetical protein
MAILAQLLVIGVLIWIGFVLLWVVFKIFEFLVKIAVALLVTGAAGWLALEIVRQVLSSHS